VAQKLVHGRYTYTGRGGIILNTSVRLDNINSFYDKDIMFITPYYNTFLRSMFQFHTVDGIDLFMFIHYDYVLGSF